MAFFRTQLDSKLRRSLLQRARVKRGGYKIGELVCFYRIEKVATKRGQWRGPGTIIGSEGGNWWVSFSGRCHLVTEEHLRPSTAEEVGDLLNMRIARDDSERLLNLDPDDPSTYQENWDQDNGEADDEGDVGDPEQDPQHEADMDFQFDLDGEQGPSDVEFLDADLDTSGAADHRRELPNPSVPPPVPKRVRRKGPGQVHSFNMLKRCLTERSLAKQYEKELPWRVIPESEHQAFKQAEDRQFQEHLDHEALEPLSVAESREVRQRVHPSRILTSRFAYRDKNWARRRVDKELPWRHKAILVIGGHRDPDVEMLQTDAPTINRLTVLILLQLVSSRRASHQWQASAGDITAAFLNGDRLDRELYLAQPRTGLKNLHPEQLLRITKSVFGLPDSPRKWWRKLKDDILGLTINIRENDYKFMQNPLDPCLFQLVQTTEAEGDPVGYIGVHVDDLLVVAHPVVSEAIRGALSRIFPIGDWEIDNFEYLGSQITVTSEGVRFPNKPTPRGDCLRFQCQRIRRTNRRQQRSSGSTISRWLGPCPGWPRSLVRIYSPESL